MEAKAFQATLKFADPIPTTQRTVAAHSGHRVCRYTVAGFLRCCLSPDPLLPVDLAAISRRSVVGFRRIPGQISALSDALMPCSPGHVRDHGDCRWSGDRALIPITPRHCLNYSY